jgi:hypothetical protein
MLIILYCIFKCLPKVDGDDAERRPLLIDPEDDNEDFQSYDEGSLLFTKVLNSEANYVSPRRQSSSSSQINADFKILINSEQEKNVESSNTTTSPVLKIITSNEALKAQSKSTNPSDSAQALKSDGLIHTAPIIMPALHDRQASSGSNIFQENNLESSNTTTSPGLKNITSKEAPKAHSKSANPSDSAQALKSDGLIHTAPIIMPALHDRQASSGSNMFGKEAANPISPKLAGDVKVSKTKSIPTSAIYSNPESNRGSLDIIHTTPISYAKNEPQSAKFKSHEINTVDATHE